MQYHLASNVQKQALLHFVISNLTGSERNLLLKIGNNYLKVTLCTFNQDKKHYTESMKELNTVKQNFGEPVASYYERSSKLCTRINSTMPSKSDNEMKANVEIIK